MHLCILCMDLSTLQFELSFLTQRQDGQVLQSLLLFMLKRLLHTDFHYFLLNLCHYKQRNQLDVLRRFRTTLWQRNLYARAHNLLLNHKCLRNISNHYIRTSRKDDQRLFKGDSKGKSDFKLNRDRNDRSPSSSLTIFSVKKRL